MRQITRWIPNPIIAESEDLSPGIPPVAGDGPARKRPGTTQYAPLTTGSIPILTAFGIFGKILRRTRKQSPLQLLHREVGPVYLVVPR